MKPTYLLVLLILIGFGLRVSGLDLQPLWWDEGWSLYAARLSPLEMVLATAADIHPPLYYALLQGWLAITGPGAEVARFLSVVIGTLFVPVAYLCGRTLGSDKDRQRLGLAAAAVVTVAPMAVYYSQEVRMYGLVALLGLVSMWSFYRLVDGHPAAFWPYILSTTLALYTNYFGSFVLAAQGLFWLLRYRHLPAERRWRLLRAVLLAGLLYLPWAWLAGQRLVNYVADKTEIEGYAPLGLLAFLESYLRAFSLGHPSAALHGYGWASLAFGLVALLGGGFWWSNRRRRPNAGLLLALYLLVPLILGWLVNLFNPFTPRYFERTLLVAAPAWWLLVGAGLLWLWQRHRRWLAGVAGLLLLINLVGLYDFYGVPRYDTEDYRPLLRKVAAIAGPEDVILASFEWQLGYYHAYLPPTRPRRYIVPGWGRVWGTDPDRMRADLGALLAHNVWFPAHQTLGRNWETQAEAIMAELGFPTLLEWYHTSTKLSLVGHQTPVEPVATVNFQKLLQATVALPAALTVQSGRGIIPVEIVWTKLDSLGSEHRVSVRLVDDRGQIWATRDSLPLAAQASFTTLHNNERLVDRHGLLIPAGTPPGSYDLQLSVINAVDETPLDIVDQAGQPQGVEATLARITVVPPDPPLGRAAVPARIWVDRSFDEQLTLLGYNIDNWTVKTGEVLPVDLYWEGIATDLPPLTTFVQLQDDSGQAVALTERPPVYPTTAWAAGTFLRDLHQLPIPATILPGTYKLAVGVLRPDKSRLHAGNDDQVLLGQVTVTSRPHSFERPNPAFTLAADFDGGATLIGYDLVPPQPMQPGETMSLTLYWQVDNGFNRNWTVFAHVIDAEGRLWAQRDQLPGDGAYPTTGWVPDEYISEVRQIALPPDIPPGVYRIEVGLYDAQSANFERVPVAGGDAVILETLLRIAAN